MKRNPTLVTFAAVVLLSGAGEASAQLFGQRNLGNSLSRRTSPSAQSSSASPQRQQQSSPMRRLSDSMFENVGTIEETARYLRGNRKATDFVGSDSGEARGFVGTQQATDVGSEVEITSAIDDFQLELSPDANMTAEPAIPARISMYPPRLQVSFDFRPRPLGEVSARVADRLASMLSLDEPSSIEVLVEGDVAILRGEVASERDRRMAGLLVRFEPGIADSRNELTVKSLNAKADTLPPRAVEQ